MSKVLIADDEHAICEAFARLLRVEGHIPIIASGGRQALDLVRTETPDAVFLDVRMPGLDGLEVLKRIRQEHPDLPVVIMTAYGTMETALEAMRHGAFDYLGKPVELARARDILRRALHRPASPPPPTEHAPEPPRGSLVGRSAPMQEVFKLMGILTTNDLTVLVTGETGVGKELVARGIHAHSERRDAPFVAVNCAAIPETLLESELFGHERGAFTGANERRLGRIEAAGDGTLFLDEIGDLPPALQVKLLRLLQEHTFERIGSHQPLALRARVIAATNRVLHDEVEAGRFREDLFHRLNLVNLHVPPLRKRPEDIALLARHFLRHASRELGKDIRDLEPAALEALKVYAWPGNVRELEHLIKRSVLLAHGPTLTVHDIALPAAAPRREETHGLDAGALESEVRHCLAAALSAQPPQTAPFHGIVERVERALVEEALRLCEGNQVAASRLLGLNRTTLRNKLERDA